jgi:hypothetical protein
MATDGGEPTGLRRVGIVVSMAVFCIMSTHVIPPSLTLPVYSWLQMALIQVDVIQEVQASIATEFSELKARFLEPCIVLRNQHSFKNIA